MKSLFDWFDHFFSYITNKTTTQHPRSQQKGVEISKEKYEIVKYMIIDILKKEREVTNIGLMKFVEDRLRGRFGKDTQWYYMVVRQDLEARNIIEYVSGLSPHRIRLKR